MSRSIGDLAASFEVPGKPHGQDLTIGLVLLTLLGAFLGAMFLGIALLAALGLGDSETAYGIVGFAAISVPLIASTVVARRYRKNMGNPRADKAAFAAAVQRSQQGYYCSRDDVAFLPGGQALRPFD